MAEDSPCTLNSTIAASVPSPGPTRRSTIADLRQLFDSPSQKDQQAPRVSSSSAAPKLVKLKEWQPSNQNGTTDKSKEAASLCRSGSVSAARRKLSQPCQDTKRQNTQPTPTRHTVENAVPFYEAAQHVAAGALAAATCIVDVTPSCLKWDQPIEYVSDATTVELAKRTFDDLRDRLVQFDAVDRSCLVVGLVNTCGTRSTTLVFACGPEGSAARVRVVGRNLERQGIANIKAEDVVFASSEDALLDVFASKCLTLSHAKHDVGTITSDDGSQVPAELKGCLEAVALVKDKLASIQSCHSPADPSSDHHTAWKDISNWLDLNQAVAETHHAAVGTAIKAFASCRTAIEKLDGSLDRADLQQAANAVELFKSALASMDKATDDTTAVLTKKPAAGETHFVQPMFGSFQGAESFRVDCAHLRELESRIAAAKQKLLDRDGKVEALETQLAELHAPITAAQALVKELEAMPAQVGAAADHKSIVDVLPEEERPGFDASLHQQFSQAVLAPLQQQQLGPRLQLMNLQNQQKQLADRLRLLRDMYTQERPEMEENISTWQKELAAKRQQQVKTQEYYKQSNRGLQQLLDRIKDVVPLQQNLIKQHRHLQGSGANALRKLDQCVRSFGDFLDSQDNVTALLAKLSAGVSAVQAMDASTSRHPDKNLESLLAGACTGIAVSKASVYKLDKACKKMNSALQQAKTNARHILSSYSPAF